jgi:hypothetical protein
VTVAVVLILVIGLALSVVIAVARDPGARPEDVAIGYARALADGDFDAVYTMTDDRVLHGTNRPRWVGAQRARPRAAIVREAVRARSIEVDGDGACIVLDVDTVGGQAQVELALRQRIWTVASFIALTSPDAPAR